jgi:uncharacterized protein
VHPTVKFYRSVADGLTLTLRVTPKASRDRIVGPMDMPEGRALKIMVSAPPDRGKANVAVCEFLAREFSVPKTAVRVVAGETDRRKIVHILGQTPALLLVAQHWDTP